VLREATLTRDQIDDELSLLALRVNNADLSLDHGFPARVIVPALPGVHNTKWVGTMTFRRRAMTLLRRGYGATPVYLLAHLAALALAAYALMQIIDLRRADNAVAWLVASVILHDLVLLPFYTMLDRVAQRLAGGGGTRPFVNYLRVPVALSALLLLVYFPVMFGLTEGNYRRVSGLGTDGYLARWLLVSGLLFAASAALFAIRLRRGDRVP
jgi:hypothetical protein